MAAAPRARTKVFGLGLSRTGTTTLSVCLKTFGYKHKSFDVVMLRKWKTHDDFDLWHAIEHHDSFEDYPWCLMYREVMERFGPNASYILTTRKDAETWLASETRHAMDLPITTQRNRDITFGLRYPQLDPRKMLDRYKTHNAGVIATAKRLGIEDRLLTVCWETGDGWEQLCPFLGVPVPDRPFPHENRGVRPDPFRALENEKVLGELMRLKKNGAGMHGARRSW